MLSVCAQPVWMQALAAVLAYLIMFMTGRLWTYEHQEGRKRITISVGFVAIAGLIYCTAHPTNDFFDLPVLVTVGSAALFMATLPRLLR